MINGRNKQFGLKPGECSTWIHGLKPVAIQNPWQFKTRGNLKPVAIQYLWQFKTSGNSIPVAIQNH